jgi:hypothetical protein
MIRPPEGLTLEAVYITMIVLACIVGIETGIIGALMKRAGSLKNLFRLATKTSHSKTTKEKDIASNDI